MRAVWCCRGRSVPAGTTRTSGRRKADSAGTVRGVDGAVQRGLTNVDPNRSATISVRLDGGDPHRCHRPHPDRRGNGRKHYLRCAPRDGSAGLHRRDSGGRQPEGDAAAQVERDAGRSLIAIDPRARSTSERRVASGSFAAASRMRARTSACRPPPGFQRRTAASGHSTSFVQPSGFGGQRLPYGSTSCACACLAAPWRRADTIGTVSIVLPTAMSRSAVKVSLVMIALSRRTLANTIMMSALV